MDVDLSVENMATRPKCKVGECEHSGGNISVSEFYRGKVVLVTGATGFLGQGLVEKLLRSCPDIGKIYIPIRPNKNGGTDQRYRHFLENKMQFATAAEKAAYYREKKKSRLKANKLKYYHKNSEIINTQRSAQKNGNVHVSNSAIRKQKSRANLSIKKENNRKYQETFRKKHKDSPGKHIHVFRNRMEKCRPLKKIKEVVPGTPKTQKKILFSVMKTNTPTCSHPSNNSVNEMIVSNVKDMVFGEVKKINPGFAEKIVQFHGDITKKNIGMDHETYTSIIHDVSVIFHCAADIRLNPSLRDSVEGNVVGTKNVFEFGKKCQNLCAYIHVSTTFSNYDRNRIEEKIYRTSETPDELIEMTKNPDDVCLLKFEKYLSRGSIYAHCKKAAENIILDGKIGEKTAVFRPCFISPALCEPYTAWTYGCAGYCGVLHHTIKGTLKHINGDPNTPIEILPVDLVVNSLICVGWYIGTGKHEKKEPLVVNANSSTDNPVTLKHLEQSVNSSFHDGRVRLNIISNRLYYFLVLITQYLLPAILLDIMMVLAGERPKYTKLLLRMRKVMQCLERTTFTFPTYEFNNAKVIHSQLTDSDRKMFPFDVSSIRWKEFLHAWVEKIKADFNK